MQARWVLGLALSYPAFGAVQVEWNAPLAECHPIDLTVSAEGRSYVTCHQPFGRAIEVYSYDLTGRLAASQSLPAVQQESLLPRDLLLHEGFLYLSLTVQKAGAPQGRLLALDPATLQIVWQKDEPQFIGNNLVPLPTGGLWWLGVKDAANNDIQAFRFNREGLVQASFRYDSGADDQLGLERRSGAAAPAAGLYIGGYSQVFHVTADGTLQWKVDFPSSAIMSRAQGELIVTHMRAPQGATAEFNAEGRRLWELDQGGSALTLAPDASVWVTGTRVTEDIAGWDVRVLHISASGQLKTVDLYEGPLQDRAVDIGTDSRGNAYVLASSYVKSGLIGMQDRYLILKYNPEGRRLWSHLYGANGLPEALQVTAQGAVYALGRDGTIRLQD
ncbi:outer membrane protein assembly factor BamB family protein [Oligoflexus tunisiensis]|uniref:outer membrane protein assembly factor BamB family protein n=1 Tax=Oligoflexus tunisiensis TaxID=708132 RepID=UPI00114D2297|nr:PQQ-binding-like beta-propeller repeat protein [Oligoflexus tunisiensis]